MARAIRARALNVDPSPIQPRRTPELNRAWRLSVEGGVRSWQPLIKAEPATVARGAGDGERCVAEFQEALRIAHEIGATGRAEEFETELE